MAKAFTSVGLIGRYNDPTIHGTMMELGEFLKQQNVRVILDEGTAEHVPKWSMETATRHSLGESCDLIIIVGGDGTLLNAARSMADYEVPLLGINRGRLGFLTDISSSHINDPLRDILDGKYTIENRFLLHVYIEREGEIISSSDAFNDVVMHKWDVARLIEIKTYIDNQYVNTIRSDGLIISTPTGSTAYALSGGGPILHPSLMAMVLVPICPHTMSNRPIVIDAGSEIRIEVKEHVGSPAQVTCDGQINLGLISGDKVIVRRKPKNVRLVHPRDYDYYDILRAKLHWSERL